MKKFLFLTLAFALCLGDLGAAPFRYLPYKIVQPNGDSFECYVSGDEFYNWIHDKDGYTIVQNADGYYYYATRDNGKIVASSLRVGLSNPKNLGVKPWIKISAQEYKQKKSKYKIPDYAKGDGSVNAPHSGTLNNIVIYIRFSDDAEITTTRNAYDDIMNSTSGYSLKTYYDEVSYGNLNISSTHYPECSSPATTNASYKDSHGRNYFRPYNATTNTLGYKTDTEAAQREHKLLYDAVTWINANSPISTGLNLDADNDGNVDNVCFMIKGNCDGWSDLLWAHRWVLYSNSAYINGKRVYDYTFQPENQVQAYVLCHEMFHALGAPDLYHYNEETFSPVGYWDIMESGKGHMGAYMKWKYAGAKWITSIPDITVSGTYTLNPLTSATNNCYKIASPNSDKEFFVLEYRKKEGTFENYVSGSGLLVYRINTNFEGNADFDNSTVFDEVYIYRPNGTVAANGNVTSAHFSSDVNRTSINGTTNPSCFLRDGSAGGLDISEVSSAGSTISFKVYISDVPAPANFVATGVSDSQINLSWTLNTDANDVVVAYSASGIIGTPVKGVNYTAGSTIPGGGVVIYSGNATLFNHQSLSAGVNYYYRIWSKTSLLEYSTGVSTNGTTYCAQAVLPITYGFNSASISPCWTVTAVDQGTTADASPSIAQVQSSQYPDATPYEGSHMLKFNSAYCGAGNSMRMESTSFSTEGKSQVVVGFSWYRDNKYSDYNDRMIIQWSTDGTTWNNGTTYQRYSTTVGWTLQSYTLPSQALQQATVKIAFLFVSEYGYNCYLDNLRITANTTGFENELLEEVKVFPNPSTGTFTVELPVTYKYMTIDVSDISGRVLYSNTYRGALQNTVNLTNLPKGLYLLKIQVDGEIVNKKIVVE